ncbi:histidine triad nucleotide-binding protein [bacterium]|nr:MAG: histidine triad nucleotide-binding protein [bacterium]RKZ16217.1 MAG: histidine triad nucleotide-binding protein [bacterium]
MGGKTGDKTLFTRIIEGEIPGDFLHRDEHCVVIRDINPQAPVHLLVIPVKPLTGIQGASQDDQELLGHLLLTARSMADASHLGSGYRLVINSGAEGGQEVEHLHVHVLGGRQMSWPPG